jgi:hypothetical protein
MVLIVVGLFLAALGVVLVSAGGFLFGGVAFFLGVTVLLTGCAAAIMRFAIRRRLVPHVLSGVAALILLALGLDRYCFSLSYVRGATEDPYQLWMSALKPFTGQVYYVGSEGEFSYFRAGAFFPARYKAPTAKIRLPRTFPLGAEEPYPVTEDMVHY